jgi:hypothetical protein
MAHSRRSVSLTILAPVLSLIMSCLHITAEASVDPLTPKIYSLAECTTQTELDCVVGMTVKHPDGSVEKAVAKWIPGAITLRDGVPRDSSYINWSFRSGSLNGPLINVAGMSELTSPESWNTNKQTGVGFPVMHIGLAGGNDAIDPRDFFSITVRTSWLNPLSVSMFARDAEVDVSLIPGGRQWIYSGALTIQSLFRNSADYNLLYDPKAPDTRADFEQTNLYWRTEHINTIINGSVWDPRCSEFGYTITSSNASSAGRPYMKNGDTLSYNIASPHFMSDGRENKGFFQADLPIAWIDCQWPGNSVTSSPKLEISVLDQNGIPQLSTNSIEVRNKVLRIRAYGFHYSAPTIVVKSVKGDASANPPATIAPTTIPSVSPTISSKPVKKLVTISCTKGKVVRKVTAISPVCPKGWIKKK